MLIKINIGDGFEHKINCIQQATRMNTSETIEKAIDLLYEKVKSIDKHELNKNT